MVALGLLRDEQAQYTEAEQLFRGALDLGRRHLASGDPRAVRAAVALGRVLINRGRYAEAVPILGETLRLQSDLGRPAPDVNITRGMLANAHYYLGHNAESYELNRQALESDRQHLGEKHPFVADDLYNLGAIQQAWGHHAEAEKLHRQALSITESFYGRDNVEVGSGLTHVGRALLGQDKLAEAKDVLHRALAIYERVYGKVHPRVASTVGELGHLAIKQGRLDDAEALFRRQADIYREVFDKKHNLHAFARANLASVSFERGDHAGAERLYRESLAGYRGAVPPGHPGVAVLEVRLARTLVMQKRFADAEPHARAGLTVLARAAPDLKYVAWAREDLAAIQEALGRPGQAAR
jgi:serine/threonine-protein kinase